MFPLTLIVVLFLLVLAQALVMAIVHKKAGAAGRTMTTGYPRDPFDPRQMR